MASVREQVSSIKYGLLRGGTGPVDRMITFSPIDPNQVLQLHEDALILTLGISNFDVRQVLVNPGSSVDLL